MFQALFERVRKSCLIAGEICDMKGIMISLVQLLTCAQTSLLRIGLKQMFSEIARLSVGIYSFYNGDFFIPNQLQKSRSILQDGSRFLEIVLEEKNSAYCKIALDGLRYFGSAWRVDNNSYIIKILSEVYCACYDQNVHVCKLV